jgi:superfamily II DNA or RNA helicase
MTIEIILPPLLSINTTLNGNTIQQIILPSQSIQADKANYISTGIKGILLMPKTENADESDHMLLVNQRKLLTESYTKIILASKLQQSQTDVLDLSPCLWLRHPHHKEVDDHANHIKEVLKSWQNGFAFLREDEANAIKGLREPQIGALHAIHAHWAVMDSPATIIMPTGTGKTETMISVLLSTPCERVLIIVPTDALRTQIAQKFLTFGVLKEFGVISSPCLHPVVGVLKHKPQTVEEVDDFFARCNVIVTTSHIAGQADEVVQERIAYHCEYLFIDEAHHIGADTWRAFKKKFEGKRILQFTATPFREDDKPVDGKPIFKYPLSRAQQKKFFTKINFRPVRVFARKKRDQAIAELAVKQLREDLQKYNHILMARVDSIPRAEKVFSIYKRYEEFNPVLLHSRIKKKDREIGKQKLISGESKIVVCVDMLGEGYDLPELKIAAFHDIRKSPAVTIQLAGRFTRSRPDLGDATFIANVGDEEVREELQNLYTRDPDWNFLLPQLSEELINEQLDLNEFAEGFNNFPKEIPIQALCPALSTVIYKTKCKEWSPLNFIEGLLGADSFERLFHDLNRDNNTLIVVTARKVGVEWTRIEEIFNWDWNLYVVFWDRTQNLLFINNSSNSGDFRRLAKAVAGDNVELIRGNVLFRCLGHITRITFKNIGLSEHGMVSYTGRMGSDVEPALSELQKQRAAKSVLVGTGFENGQKTSIGVSAKGRIWCHARSYQINKLIEWCSSCGSKVLDETIDPDEFLKNTLTSEFIGKRPSKMPFGIDWNEDIYKATETAIGFVFNEDAERQLYEVDICLVEPRTDGELRFEIKSEEITSTFSIILHKKNDIADFSIERHSESSLMVEWGVNRIPAEEFFYEYPPMIWFTDGSSLCGSKYTHAPMRLQPYPKNKIQAWNWPDAVDIQKESQKRERRPDSVQYHVISQLKMGGYDVVFDDDASGEAADIITIKVDDDKKLINVEFYHCKFSGGKKPGARVDDLYQVCGQSQKSIRWLINPRELFLHMLRREEKRRDDEGGTRIEVGSTDKIDEIAEKSSVYKTDLKVSIVQPGLSKSQVSEEQLELLSVTESYLKDTYLIPITVIASR